MLSQVSSLRQAVCLALCLVAFTAGSDIAFTSSPSTIRPLLTDEITLRCSITDSPSSVVIGKRSVRSASAPSDVSFVHSIIIKKSGVELASVSEHFPAKVLDNSTGVKVTGSIPGSGAERGFLAVTWKYPGHGQSGNYECDVTGMDINGHDHDFSQALDVTDSEVSINDMVSYIHQLKLDHDLHIADLNSNISDLKAVVNSNVTDLQVEMNSLKTSNAELKTKLNTHVLFTAVLTSSVTISSHQTVVFNQLRSNVGGGYNVSTGVFTCPVAGYYHFDVHFLTNDDQSVEFCLSHNNVGCVTAGFADDAMDKQSASSGASLQLQRGDTIKVTTVGNSHTFGSQYGYCSFSGHLFAVA